MVAFNPGSGSFNKSAVQPNNQFESQLQALMAAAQGAQGQRENQSKQNIQREREPSFIDGLNASVGTGLLLGQAFADRKDRKGKKGKGGKTPTSEDADGDILAKFQNFLGINAGGKDTGNLGTSITGTDAKGTFSAEGNPFSSFLSKLFGG